MNWSAFLFSLGKKKNDLTDVSQDSINILKETAWETDKPRRKNHKEKHLKRDSMGKS